MLLIEMFTDERERLAVTRSSQSVFVPFLNNHISCEIFPYIAWRYTVIYITGNVIERCSLEWSTSNSYLWFCNITPSDWRKNSRHFVIQLEVNQTNRDSLALILPSFLSTTRVCFEFWLVHRIVCVLCDCLEWLWILWFWFWFCDNRMKTALSMIFT